MEQRRTNSTKTTRQTDTSTDTSTGTRSETRAGAPTGSQSSGRGTPRHVRGQVARRWRHGWTRPTRRIGRARLTLAMAAALALPLAACTNPGDTGASGGETIVIGSLNALSGAATYPEASQAAKAVFDRANADGGINGKQIEYVILDDKTDPATASAVAREAVEARGAVAMVGSASFVDCEVNGEYYVQQGISSIQGTGVDQFCFQNKAIAPANAGPFADTQMTLTYGSEELGLEKICGLLEVVGSTKEAYLASIDAWTQDTGKKLAYLDDTVPYGGSDYTTYIVNAKNKGCDAIYSNAVQPDGIGQLKAAAAQGWDDVTFLYLTSVYSEEFAKAAQDVGKGVYVPAEFLPYTDPSLPANKDWYDLMTQNDIQLSSFAQGGYLAATYMVEVLGSIDGEVTRESVNEALKTMKPIETGMTATPFVFGDAEQHTPNRGGWPIKLVPGSTEWETAGEDWIRLDS